MTKLSRPQIFEVSATLVIFFLGLFLAVNDYASWLLAITGAGLFTLNISLILLKKTKRTSKYSEQQGEHNAA